MKLSIIIPNYNGEKYLPNCLRSIIIAHQNTKNLEIELILIDNNSSDKSVDIFKKETWGIKNIVLTQNNNSGFAASVNLGIKNSTSEFVFLLNNDVTLDKNWLKIIAKKIAENPKYSAFFGTILSKDGTKYESTGFIYNKSGKCINTNNKMNYCPEKAEQKDKEIWGASAAAIVYKKNALEEIGLFDEDFFAYEEDVDVAIRLRFNRHKTLFIPSAISYHIGGATSDKVPGFRAYHDTKNWHYIIIKNYPLKTIIFNLPVIFVERLKNLTYLYKNTPHHKILTIIKMYIEVFTHLKTMLNKRKDIQKLVKYKQDDYWN